MAANYRFLVYSSSTGLPLGEVPLTNVSFSDVLNGYGVLTGTLPLSNAQAALISVGKTDIGVLRNETLCPFYGPVVSVEADLESKRLTVTAYTTWWIFTKRVFEASRQYNRDLFSAARDVIDLSHTKSPNADVTAYAPIPNWSVATLGSAGVTIRYNVADSDKRSAADIIDDLSADPTNGFDYRVDFTVNAGVPTINKSFRMAKPFLGVDATARPLEPGNGLINLNCREEIEEAANRVHILGAGTGSTSLRSRVNAISSLSAGYLLIEEVINRNDIRVQSSLNQQANEARRYLYPPIRRYTATYRPTAALPYAFCDLGDKVKINVTTGYFANVPTTRRVIGIKTMVDDQREETVELTFANPSDTVTS